VTFLRPYPAMRDRERVAYRGLHACRVASVRRRLERRAVGESMEGQGWGDQGKKSSYEERID
jgi:hypothetical protein